MRRHRTLHDRDCAPRGRGWLVLAVVAASLAIALPTADLGSTAHAAPTRIQRTDAPSVGMMAPEITGRAVHGADPIDLSRLQGQVVILDFWATWCRPCRAVMPFLDRLHAQHRTQGLRVLGLTSEPAARVQSHLGAQPVGYTVASDARQTMLRYAIRGLPTLIVIDRNGKVRHVSAGASPDSLRELEQLIPRLLAESP